MFKESIVSCLVKIFIAAWDISLGHPPLTGEKVSFRPCSYISTNLLTNNVLDSFLRIDLGAWNHMKFI